MRPNCKYQIGITSYKYNWGQICKYHIKINYYKHNWGQIVNIRLELLLINIIEAKFVNIRLELLLINIVEAKFVNIRLELLLIGQICKYQIGITSYRMYCSVLQNFFRTVSQLTSLLSPKFERSIIKLSKNILITRICSLVRMNLAQIHYKYFGRSFEHQ